MRIYPKNGHFSLFSYQFNSILAQFAQKFIFLVVFLPFRVVFILFCIKSILLLLFCPFLSKFGLLTKKEKEGCLSLFLPILINIIEVNHFRNSYCSHSAILIFGIDFYMYHWRVLFISY